MGPLDELVPTPTDARDFASDIHFNTTWPYRHGKNSEWHYFVGSHIEGDVRQQPSRDVTAGTVSLVQSWLFLGLLSEFFSRRIELVHIMSPLGTRLDGDRFCVILRDWHAALCKRSASGRRDHLDHLRRIIASAASHVERHDSGGPISIEGIEERRLATMLLFTKVMIEYLQSLCTLEELFWETYSTCTLFGTAFFWVTNWRTLISDKAGLWTSRPRNAMFGKSPRIAANLKTSDYVATYERFSSKLFRALAHTDVRHHTRSGMLLQRWFEENHWCPVATRDVLREQDYTMAYYLSRIDRAEASPDINHTRCEERCAAYDVTTEYRPKHIYTDCECKLGPPVVKDSVTMTPHEEALADIILKGAVPLISLNPKATEADYDIRVEEYDGLQPFTTVSHVWSEGRGNDFHSAVPMCQLRSIVEQMRVLDNERYRQWTPAEVLWESTKAATRLFTRWERPRLYLWMDTLCIPAPGKSKKQSDNQDWKQALSKQGKLALETRETVRKLAIGRMTPIYQASDQTLVMDRDLQTIRKNTLTEDDLAARIFCSKWAQRAWTFQEGSLARDCRFVGQTNTPMVLRNMASRQTPRWYHSGPLKGLFPHRPMRVEDAAARKRSVADRKQSETSAFPYPLKVMHRDMLNESRKAAVRAGRTARDTREYDNAMAERLTLVYNRLLGRSATWPSDTLAILASLLDFDASQVKTKAIDLHIPAMIDNLRELPLSLLFNTRACVRIHKGFEPRNSWIPTRIEGDRLTNAGKIINPYAELVVQPTLYSRLMKDGVPKKVNGVERGDGLQAYLQLQPASGTVALFVNDQAEIHPTDYLKIHVLDSFLEHKVIELHCPSQRLKATIHDRDGKVDGERVSEPAERADYLIKANAARARGKYLYMIDVSAGATSLAGYSARGARFNVVTTDEEPEIRLEYDCPLTVWAASAWKAADSRPQLSEIEEVAVDELHTTKTLQLRYHESPVCDPLKRLPLRPAAPHQRPGWIWFQTTSFIFLYIFLASLPTLLVIYERLCRKSHPGCTSEEKCERQCHRDVDDATIIDAILVFFVGVIIFSVSGDVLRRYFVRRETRNWLRAYTDKVETLEILEAKKNLDAIHQERDTNSSQSTWARWTHTKLPLYTRNSKRRALRSEVDMELA